MLSKADFDADVADTNTDTSVDDLQINQKITVASLQFLVKPKNNATSRRYRNTIRIFKKIR
jgi:hypothetical protein